MRTAVFALTFVLLASLALAAETINYTIDQSSTGLASGNASTASYTFTSTTTYTGNSNISTSKYIANSGVYNESSTASTIYCGNSIVETGESCDDGEDNGACPKTCSTSCTSNSCGISSSSSSGSSGGGGSSSGGATTLPLSTETKTASFTAGEATEVKFDAAKSQVSDITITATETIKNVKIVAASLPSKPKDISGPVINKLYKYLEINHTALSNTKIKEASITFAVERSWYEKNKVPKEKTLLLRYNDNRWDELETSYQNSDSNNHYFEAKASGLSYFAIGVKTTAEEITPTGPATKPQETPLPEQNQPSPAKTEDTTGKGNDTQAATSTGTGPVAITLLAVIITAALVFFALKSKAGKKKEETSASPGKEPSQK